MQNICLLPIYRRTYQENLQEMQSEIEKLDRTNKSKNYINLMVGYYRDLYRYSFNQVCGFIYVYLDDLFHLKIKLVMHKGNVVLNGKYNFKDEKVIYDAALLKLSSKKIVETIKESVCSIKLRNKKFFIDDTYIDGIDISKRILVQLSKMKKFKYSLEKEDDYVKCYMILTTSVEDVVSEEKYNEYLLNQIKNKQCLLFPFVSYLSQGNPEIIKLINEDLTKYSPCFKEITLDTRGIVEFEFNEKIKSYCRQVGYDFNKIKNLSPMQKMKFVYCHYYNNANLV